MAVAHYHAVIVIVTLVRVIFEILADFFFECMGDHVARSLAGQFVQWVAGSRFDPERAGGVISRSLTTRQSGIWKIRDRAFTLKATWGMVSHVAYPFLVGAVIESIKHQGYAAFFQPAIHSFRLYLSCHLQTSTAGGPDQSIGRSRHLVMTASGFWASDPISGLCEDNIPVPTKLLPQ
jgi:hypothetical protein